MDCIVSAWSPLKPLKMSATSICVPPYTLEAATRAALCVPALMVLQLVLPLPWGIQGPVVCMCFLCSGLIKILPETHSGVSHRPSCCLLLCCPDRGCGSGSCNHQFRICDLGHPQAELSTSVIPAGRESALLAFCMGIFLPMIGLGTLSLGPLSGS